MKKNAMNENSIEYYEIEFKAEEFVTPVNSYISCNRLIERPLIIPKGLQDIFKKYPRTEDEREKMADKEYRSVYGYEADLPIIREWFENIPESTFMIEIISRYVLARNWKRMPRILECIPAEAEEQLAQAIQTYFKTVEEVRDNHTKVSFTPADLR